MLFKCWHIYSLLALLDFFFFLITWVYFEGCLTKDYSSNGVVQR